MLSIYMCPVCSLGMTVDEYDTHTHTAAEIAVAVGKIRDHYENHIQQVDRVLDALPMSRADLGIEPLDDEEGYDDELV